MEAASACFENAKKDRRAKNQTTRLAHVAWIEEGARDGLLVFGVL